MRIELQNVCKGYQDGKDSQRIVFENLSYVFDDEQSSVAILGQSGCGKTTLLTLLGLMHTPDSGTIVYDGEDVTRLSVKERADYRLKNIGFIFQDFNLIDELTLWENVAVPAVALGSSFRAEREKAIELLSQVQCGGLAERYPSEVSGGQIQRCAIARALINSPKLVLADEPTGNLDPATADNVIDLLLGLSDNTKVIMVTHDVKNAYRVQQVLSLSGGHLSVAEPSAEAVEAVRP